MRRALLVALVGLVACAAPAAKPATPAKASGNTDDDRLARMTAETGYRPQFDITAGIADYAAWLRANEE